MGTRKGWKEGWKVESYDNLTLDLTNCICFYILCLKSTPFLIGLSITAKRELTVVQKFWKLMGNQGNYFMDKQLSIFLNSNFSALCSLPPKPFSQERNSSMITGKQGLRCWKPTHGLDIDSGSVSLYSVEFSPLDASSFNSSSFSTAFGQARFTTCTDFFSLSL